MRGSQLESVVPPRKPDRGGTLVPALADEDARRQWLQKFPQTDPKPPRMSWHLSPVSGSIQVFWTFV